MLKQLSALLTSLLLCLPVAAQDLAPFHASYSASYRGLRARAERSLAQVGEEDYRMASSVKLELLGKTLTRIEEASVFTWNGEGVLPQSYSFVQTGLGARERSIAFDWNSGTAEARVDDSLVALPLEGLVFDELNAYVELTRQLAAGAREVALMTVDKDRIEEERYRVVNEVTVETPLGDVPAIELEKVRDPGSPRITRIWLAPQWDYLLVKLYQRDADGREMDLALTGAVLDGQPLRLPGSAE